MDILTAVQKAAAGTGFSEFGFVVSELAREANIRGHHGENTVTFFGALLFR